MGAVVWRKLDLGDVPVYVLWDSEAQTDLVFAPFHRSVFLARPVLRSMPQPDLLRVLAELRELRERSHSPEDLLGSAHDQSKGTFHISVGLSNNCTMACTYCHAEASVGSRPIDPSLLAIALRSSILEAANERRSGVLASFTAGGEPTYEWAQFTSTVDLLKLECARFALPLRLQMTTNGFYGHEKRKYIAEHFDSVTLSLDGLPAVQNRQRPSAKGGDTFDLVFHTAQYLASAQFRFAIRATVTRSSAEEMEEFVRFIFREIGSVPTAFEPIVPVGRAAPKLGRTSPDWQTNDASLDWFCIPFWRAYLAGEEIGVPVSTSSVNLRKLVPNMCGAMTLPARTFASNGLITGCHRDNRGNFAYGKMGPDGISIDSSRLEMLSKLAEPPQECAECYCRFTCAGDCPDLRINGLTRCEAVRKLTYWSLRRRVEGRESKTGGTA